MVATAIPGLIVALCRIFDLRTVVGEIETHRHEGAAFNPPQNLLTACSTPSGAAGIASTLLMDRAGMSSPRAGDALPLSQPVGPAAVERLSDASPNRCAYTLYIS